MKPSEKAADDKHRVYGKTRKDFKDLKNVLKKSARSFVSEARAFNRQVKRFCATEKRRFSIAAKSGAVHCTRGLVVDVACC